MSKKEKIFITIIAAFSQIAFWIVLKCMINIAFESTGIFEVTLASFIISVIGLLIWGSVFIIPFIWNEK